MQKMFSLKKKINRISSSSLISDNKGKYSASLNLERLNLFLNFGTKSRPFLTLKSKKTPDSLYNLANHY